MDELEQKVNDYINNNLLNFNNFPETSLNKENFREEVLKRITGRQMCKECGANYNINYKEQSPKKEGICDKCGGNLIQRSDDTEESIFNRLDIFYNETLPLIEIYKKRNILHEINGMGTVEEVFKDIKDVLGDK